MSKHPPAPWFVLGDDKVGCVSGFVAFMTCNPRTIDETRLQNESWLDMRNRTAQDRADLSEEVKSNARLIAAAPELLEALKACAAAANFHDRLKARANAEAVIAKATGEQA
jgi:hypothetical protein